MTKTRLWKTVTNFLSNRNKLVWLQQVRHIRHVHSSSMSCDHASPEGRKNKRKKSSSPIKTIRPLELIGRIQLLDIKDKVAIIAGGCTGICLATAKELLRQKAKHVVLTGKEPADGADAIMELYRDFIPSCASRVVYKQLDVTNSHEFEEVFRQTLHQHKHVDMLFNVAAMMDDSRWEYEVDTNINGMVRGVLLAFRYMGPRSVGLPPLLNISRRPRLGAGIPVVVNMACVVGLDPLAGAPVYSLTQSAAIALTRCFGAPFHASRTGVRVLCLYTGITSEDALLDDEQHLKLKLLNREWTTVAQQQLKEMPVQGVCAAAKAALFLVRFGTSGSAWVVEDSELSRLEVPRHSDFYHPTASFK